MRLNNQWYFDGTFTIVPSEYNQSLTIAIRDPITDFIKPAMWAILNTKDEESYYQTFRIIKDIVSSSGALNWNLTSITLDFETGLFNGFQRVFPNTRIIGCLFHFKQALFREAQVLGLTTNELKSEAINLISLLGSLSWLGDIKAAEKQLDKLEKEKKNTKYIKLVEYYKDSWLDRLKSGLINYSSVEDELRANSVLEQYNCHVKDSLPRNSSWPKLIDFLQKEEADYVRESFLAEQKGEIQVKSLNHGKTYLPKPLKKTKRKLKNKLPKVTKKKIKGNTMNFQLALKIIQIILNNLNSIQIMIKLSKLQSLFLLI